MGILHRLKGIEGTAEGEANRTTSDHHNRTYSQEFEDDLTARMRDGIITTLSPFVTDDAMSGMLIHTVRRMLQRASIEQLIEVVQSADHFVTEMGPYLVEYYGETPDAGHADTDSGSVTNGSRTDSGSESLREVDPIGADHPAFLEQVQRGVSGIGSGYETPVAGNEDRNGSVHSEAV
jgi:hypothetical protein